LTAFFRILKTPQPLILVGFEGLNNSKSILLKLVKTDSKSA